MAITSSAFERGGALPKQYTCDGANISPPLEWQNVPAKAAALVLIMIDDSSTGPASGIRWFVGDINPGSKGVAAGQTPEGGIVGSDTQGKSGYGGICPAKGKTSTIEFEMYALSKKIPLTPGFSPSLAESEYGQGKLLMGEAAVTYATYTRG
jgi:Raf kinase inhibitor-like YbhB/YbcL family protein